MSRTYRKKYVPMYYRQISERVAESIEYAETYSKTGRDPMGLRWWGRNHTHDTGLRAIRTLKSFGIDSVRTHNDPMMKHNRAKKWIPTSLLRQELRREMQNMRSSRLGWDEHTINPNKARANARGIYEWETGLY